MNGLINIVKFIGFTVGSVVIRKTHNWLTEDVDPVPGTKEFAQELQDGSIFLSNSASIGEGPVFETRPKPLPALEPSDRNREGRNHFFTGILVMLPMAVILWGIILWCCKNLLF